MLIKSIQINNFGKLSNKNIEFKKGINLIQGENESGKSTLLKFMTSMFYGISKNKNGKRLSDYDKYYPWKEGEFSGKIRYMLDNTEEYEVYRNFTKKNPQIIDKIGNDVSKNYTIDKTYGNKFFLEQTKVDEDLFNMAMVIMQQEVKLDDKEQNALIQKASNIMLTGEDDVSYKKIISKLNKKQNDEIGTDKSPTKPLYLIKQKIEKLKQEKEQLNEMLPKQYEIEEKIRKTEEEIKSGENELELLQNIQKVQNEIKLEKEKIIINQKLKEETENKKIQEEENLSNIKSKKIEKKSFKKLYIIPILLTIISIIMFMTNFKIISCIGIILDFLCITVIIYKQNKENKMYNKQKETEKQEKNIIKNKIEVLENEIKEREKIIDEQQNKIDIQLNIRKKEIKMKFSNIEEIDNLFEKEINDENIVSEQRYINELKLELNKLEIYRKEILQKLENKSNIEEQLESSKEKLEELIEYNEAINIAKIAIEQAYIKMKEDITPKFTINLSNAVQNISNGKYKTVKVNDDEGLMVETENGNYVPADILSIGTIDQLYLSLRISSINELTQENMPIILDETFAYFDEQRLRNVLTFLNKTYNEKQIFILTCTNREKEILEKLGIEFNKIELV